MAKTTMKKYRVFSDHQRAHLELPKMTLEGVQGLAQAAAELGHDSLYRAFEVTAEGGMRFATAYSVLGGKVREHRDVTIPVAHW